MTILKNILAFFLSLKTVFGLFAACMAVCLIGSLTLPANLAFFSGIDDTPLFRWLSDAGDPKLIWWIHGLISLMALLALSTIICTIDALLNIKSGKNLIFRLSPQVMHLGVLFVMLGHLLTAATGTREDILIRKTETKDIGSNTLVCLEDLKVKEDESGYYSDWEATLRLIMDGDTVKSDVLKPVQPVYHGKLGLYFKSISMAGEPSALIRVCRDPGAAWTLLGGVLVSIGGVGFIYSRIGTRREVD
jgi:hypothetical protein